MSTNELFKGNTLSRLIMASLIAVISFAIMGCSERAEEGNGSVVNNDDTIATEDLFMSEELQSTEELSVTETMSQISEDKFNLLDTDGDGVLSYAEFLEAHLAKYALLDTDGDGSISREDFLKIKQAKLEEHFATLDVDGDGVLSSDELNKKQQKIMDLDSDGDGRISLAEWNAVKDSVEGFEKMDVNDDGFIDEEELKARRMSKKEGKGSKKGKDSGPKNLDVDGDGVVSKVEFLNMETKFEKHFSAFDTNGDQILTSDEISTACNTRFAYLDANGDGGITQDELSDQKHGKGRKGRK